MAAQESGLNERELKRHEALERLKPGALSQLEAAGELGMSARQVRRLQRSLEEAGPAGLCWHTEARSQTTGLTRVAGKRRYP